jgi:hypothetical protein
VSLTSQKLDKETIASIESLADSLLAARTSSATPMVKKAIVKGIPRHAVLKPSHAQYRLTPQRFSIHNRVVMVRDEGSVPLGAKGTVVSTSSATGGKLDIVWDTPFVTGTTLGGRCSEYRGSSLEGYSVLNLSEPQFVATAAPVGKSAESQASENHATISPTNHTQQPRQVRIMMNPQHGRARGAGLGYHSHPNGIGNSLSGVDRASSSSPTQRGRGSLPRRSGFSRRRGHTLNERGSGFKARGEHGDGRRLYSP